LAGYAVTDTFDFVVVGGGSGGCAVASRLSEDPATSVALLEAGGRNDTCVDTTPGALVLMVAGKVNNWALETVPQPGLNGRIGHQPRGKGLGGSSAINAMVYIRGHSNDYDEWASLSESPMPTCCPISSAGRTMPTSKACIKARAARSPSINCAEEQEGLGIYQVRTMERRQGLYSSVHDNARQSAG
jgi:choline dehydrogenase-like flavoprotein